MRRSRRRDHPAPAARDVPEKPDRAVSAQWVNRPSSVKCGIPASTFWQRRMYSDCARPTDKLFQERVLA
jgi:hypothetical protein